MTKDWISLKEAADIVGVHPSPIRLWSDKGILPVHRTPGGHRRFRRADASGFLAAKSANHIELA